MFLQEGTLNSLHARHRPLEHKGTTHREYEYNSITLNESTTNKTDNKKVIFAGFVATRKISTIYNNNYAILARKAVRCVEIVELVPPMMNLARQQKNKKPRLN